MKGAVEMFDLPQTSPPVERKEKKRKSAQQRERVPSKGYKPYFYRP
jgi:hypothetical protein